MVATSVSLTAQCKASPAPHSRIRRWQNTGLATNRLAMQKRSSYGTNHRERRQTVAFTLIELLLVIGVVAVFGCVSLSKLRERKHKAQRIRCTSHMKQTSYAFRIWAGDHQVVAHGSFRRKRRRNEAVMAGNVAAVFLVMSE